MKRTLLIVVLGAALLGLLILPALASAYTFTMNFNGAPGTGVTATATCEGNYQTGGTGYWLNTNMRTHWKYNKLSGIQVSLGAHYQIILRQGTTSKWSTNTYGVLSDNYYNAGSSPPAHWRSWTVNVKTTRGNTSAWWFIEGPYGDTHTHTTAKY